MSAAREHQQTMASVVLGCRGVTKAGRVAGAVREHPSAGRQGVRLSGDAAAAPERARHREVLITTLGLQCQPAETIRGVCMRAKPSQAPRPWVPRPATDKPRALLPWYFLRARDFWPPFWASRRAWGATGHVLRQEHLCDAPYTSIPMAARAPGIMNFSCA